MTRHRHFLFFFSIILLISGCNGDHTPTEPSPTAKITVDSKVPPIVNGAPSSSPTTAQSTPDEDVSSANPTLKMSTPQKSDSIIGDILKVQSFYVTFENLGESEFITTEEKIDGKKLPHFYFKRGDMVTELKYEPESPESVYSVSAVSFRDVSADGKKDIVVIANYTTGFGYMGAIPISQLLIFKQTDTGFIKDHSIEERARSGVPYRILTVEDVMVGLKTDPKDSISNAWKQLHPGTYKLNGLSELSGSTITIVEASGDGLSFNLDAFYASNKEAMMNGGVNIGTIDSGKAIPSYAEMIFRDGQYELSLSLISSTDLYVRDNGESYFGHNVFVNGTYSPMK